MSFGKNKVEETREMLSNKKITITGTDFPNASTKAREKFSDLPVEMQLLLTMFSADLLHILLGDDDNE